MSVLKFVGKALGVATLFTTGTASAILKGVSDTVGFELGSELLDSAKNASFNGARSILGHSASPTMDKLDALDDAAGTAARRKMAETARKVAEIARKNGDMDRYEHYMDQYEMYRD